MRQNKELNYMEHAEVAAKRSHDIETQVGAILVKNDSGAIIATGFNGFLRGANDLSLPSTRPDKYEYMMHAEENLISHCARHGISVNGCTLYCTLTPCTRCTRILWQCGISSVIAKAAYSDFENKIMVMKDLNVSYSENEHGFLEISYGVWK